MIDEERLARAGLLYFKGETLSVEELSRWRTQFPPPTPRWIHRWRALTTELTPEQHAEFTDLTGHRGMDTLGGVMTVHRVMRELARKVLDEAAA